MHTIGYWFFLLFHRYGKLKVVTFLTEETTIDVNARNDLGWTALHYASMSVTIIVLVHLHNYVLIRLPFLIPLL